MLDCIEHHPSLLKNFLSELHCHPSLIIFLAKARLIKLKEMLEAKLKNNNSNSDSDSDSPLLTTLIKQLFSIYAELVVTPAELLNHPENIDAILARIQSQKKSECAQNQQKIALEQLNPFRQAALLGDMECIQYLSNLAWENSSPYADLFYELIHTWQTQAASGSVEAILTLTTCQAQKNIFGIEHDPYQATDTLFHTILTIKNSGLTSKEKIEKLLAKIKEILSNEQVIDKLFDALFWEHGIYTHVDKNAAYLLYQQIYTQCEKPSKSKFIFSVLEGQNFTHCQHKSALSNESNQSIEEEKEKETELSENGTHHLPLSIQRQTEKVKLLTQLFVLRHSINPTKEKAETYDVLLQLLQRSIGKHISSYHAISQHSSIAYCLYHIVMEKAAYYKENVHALSKNATYVKQDEVGYIEKLLDSEFTSAQPLVLLCCIEIIFDQSTTCLKKLISAKEDYINEMLKFISSGLPQQSLASNKKILEVLASQKTGIEKLTEITAIAEKKLKPLTKNASIFSFSSFFNKDTAGEKFLQAIVDGNLKELRKYQSAVKPSSHGNKQKDFSLHNHL